MPSGSVPHNDDSFTSCGTIYCRVCAAATATTTTGVWGSSRGQYRIGACRVVTAAVSATTCSACAAGAGVALDTTTATTRSRYGGAGDVGTDPISSNAAGGADPVTTRGVCAAATTT
jgi:hypothetical protein